MHKNISLIALVLTIKMRKPFLVFFSFIVLVSFLFIYAQNAPASNGVESGVQLEQRVFEIARSLRCPTCRAESAADSNSVTSIEFRNIIQEKLEEGQSEAEIIAFFQASYGDWILLDPPKRGLHLIVWIAPLVASVIALIVFLVLLRRWTRKANIVPAELTAEELEQVQNALKESDTKSPDDTGVNDIGADSGAKV